MRPKRKSVQRGARAIGNYSPVIRGSFARWPAACGAVQRELRGGFFRCRAKIAFAGLAGTNFAQVLEAENSRRVAVGKLNLNRVVPHRIGALGGDARLVHGQQGRAGRGSALGFLLALVVAQRAGAMIPQKRKIVAAGMLVRPGDLHAFTRRDVHLDARRLFSRVLCYGHEESIPRLRYADCITANRLQPTTEYSVT